MKYIFITGAPGSKWSSVSKNIYYSPTIDRSDYSEQRTYYHEASGKRDLMHIGAYFDPEMEFNLPDNLMMLSKDALEDIFDSAFTGEGIRIIKSHIFANNIDFLKACWPDCPIILVYRSNDSCLGWWVRCGHFNITYPNYSGYYKDLQKMSVIINNQNDGIQKAWNMYHGKEIYNNQELIKILNIEAPPKEYQQNYVLSDVRVKVI
jgi:hypothetical protein